MLFNSYIFILAFLPITLLGYYWLGSAARFRLAVGWLVAMSLLFYGWWNPTHLPLILSSLFFNYAAGFGLSRRRRSRRRLQWLLISAIGTNLGLLGYFKYAHFFVESVNHIGGMGLALDTIVLPLAISFFTFQQIAYLVDAYRGETDEHDFLDYCLFVTFFPQLIAGPIVHHWEMLPQFRSIASFRWHHERLSLGLTMFTLGLFKKVVVADGVGAYASPVFESAAMGLQVSFADTWVAAIAYSFQLYFDFSGYSDMAIGLAWMFGIALPLNFDSPYKATSIIDFWRRWHITLSRFLRDYVYVPLGGNRAGMRRRYLNLMVTMLLGGLWHGAGWTFVLWGGVHGIYLVINHAWNALVRSFGGDRSRSTWAGRLVGRTATFLAVAAGWVLFRAADLATAQRMLEAMGGMHGFAFSDFYMDEVSSLADASILSAVITDVTTLQQLSFALVPLFFVVWGLPNSAQLLAAFQPVVANSSERVSAASLLRWRPGPGWGVAMATLFGSSILSLTSVNEFIYFQF